jgi:hypothetical protein
MVLINRLLARAPPGGAEKYPGGARQEPAPNGKRDAAGFCSIDSAAEGYASLQRLEAQLG